MVQWVVTSRVVIQTVYVRLVKTLLIGYSSSCIRWRAIEITTVVVVLPLVLLSSAASVERLSWVRRPKVLLLLADRVVNIWYLLGQLLVLVGWLLRIVKEACLVGRRCHLRILISTIEGLLFCGRLVGRPFKFSLLLGVHTDSIRLVWSLKRLTKLVSLALLEIVLSKNFRLRGVMHSKLTLKGLVL